MLNKITLKLSGQIFISLLFSLVLCLNLSGNVVAEEEFVYDAQDRPDPFMPWVTPDGRLQVFKSRAEKTNTEIDLQGIVYDQYSRSFAIVNSEVVKIGDIIDDYQVLNIEKNKVTFIKDGEQKVVELKKED